MSQIYETIKDLIIKHFQTTISADIDIDKLIEEQPDYNMMIPPKEDEIFVNQWGCVLMSVITLDKIIEKIREES